MLRTIDCPQLLEIDTGARTHSVEFTADGKHLVGRAVGNIVGIWRVKDGERVPTQMQTKGPVWAFAVSKDGRFIAAGLQGGGVSVWDATTYKQIFVGELKSDNTSCDVDFSPDTSRLVCACDDGTATIWDIVVRQKVRPLSHDGPVHTAKYSPQGDRIATATSKSIRIWDSNDGRLLVDIKVAVLGQITRAFDKPIRSSDGQMLGNIKVAVLGRGILWFNNLYLFVAAKDNTIKQIDAATGSTVSYWAVPGDHSVPHIALPQHGKFIAHSTSKTLSFWDTETHTQLGSAQSIDYIRSFAFSPDGQLLAIGSREKIIVKSVISRFVEVDIDSAALDAWRQGRLTDAEALLTNAIPTSEHTSHHALASRALVRAHLGLCDAALMDAEKSIEIQRSLVGYVAKCVAFVYMGEKDKGIRMCEIASRHFPEHTTLILLIKAVVLSMAGEHVDAMSRINDLITDSVDTPVDLSLYVVQAYMHLLLGNEYMESGDYERAIQSFEDVRAGLGNRTHQPPLIVSLISGWRFDDLMITAQQRVCEALFVADRTMEAVLRMADPETSMDVPIKTWVSDFKSRCRGKLEHHGDTAMNDKQYDEAISQYTAALSLDPASPQDLLYKRSETFALTGKREDALNDADEIIKLDPSSPSGYERKYQALCGAGHSSEAIAAFKMMLSKMSTSPDTDIRPRSQHYVRPEAIQERIRSTMKKVVHGFPPVLINVNSGRLCNKSERITAFESTPMFTDLVCSMTTRIDHALIEQVARKYFRYVMFSHTWQGNEPLYENVVKIVVYDLNTSPTHTKLQMFCKVARDEGFEWAWSDTCCIEKRDHFVLQEALVRMFRWYAGSAMTIIYLFDVDELAELGALVMSKWNSRGWTLQEYLASKVVRIYTKNWKPYLGLTVYNHKESPEVISEMEQATGVSALALTALRPGLSDVREKLRLASTRKTTRVEDSAYSLLGIFSMTLPMTYGEGDRALGRLLSQLLTGSGDARILAWTGSPGSFNSCLPTSISVFSQPLTLHVPPAIVGAELDTITAGLRASLLDFNLPTSLYYRVDELRTATFTGQRLRLPCLTFKIRIVSGRPDGFEYIFSAEAGALGLVEIKTKQNLMRPGHLYLVHPWISFLLDRHASGSNAEMAAEDGPSELGDFSFDSPPKPSSAWHARQSSPMALTGRRMYEFLARVGKPFGALLLASNPRNRAEYKRIATETLITVQVKDITSTATLEGLMGGIRVLDVL